MKNFIINADGSTTNGQRIVDKLILETVVSVTLTKRSPYYGGPADMTLTFSDGYSITITNAFGIGYGGTGPSGAYDVLLKLGFKPDECNSIFVPGTEKLTFAR